MSCIRPRVAAASLASLASIVALGAFGAFGQTGCLDASSTEATRASRQSIIGGETTTAYPDVGLVSSGCTATLIHPQAVLTASHCCPSKSSCKSVIFRGNNKVNVQKVIVNPDFRRDAGQSGTGITPSVDVALLWLDTKVEGITPRKLASSAPTIGRPIRFVGFGCNTFDADASDNGFGTKRTGTNTIAFFGTDVDGKDGERFQNVFGWKSEPDDAGIFSSTDANICPGDSGGPTFWDEGGEEVLAGIHTLVGPTFGYSTEVANLQQFIDAELPPCAEGDTEACGECGVRTCNADLTWSACAIDPDHASRACGDGGAQTCQDDATYGVCEDPTATPPSADDPTDGCDVAHTGKTRRGAVASAGILAALVLVSLRRRRPR